MPILMFCIAFGLSMDYRVFLLPRIKDEYESTGDSTQDVAIGLERTGRIVTAAAALLAVTFLAFGISGVTFIKMFGFGLALAVVTVRPTSRVCASSTSGAGSRPTESRRSC